MPPRNRALFSALLGVLFLMAALPLLRAFSQREDIWWTPKPMALPLSESQDRVQIFVRDQALSELIEAGQLQMVEAGSPQAIAANEVRLRFNNWDKVRAARIPGLLVNAAACGALAVLFIVLVTGRLNYRDEKAAMARMPSS